jgi:hypothetical protein
VTDRLHLVEAQRMGGGRCNEPLAKLEQGALGDRMQQVVLVAEVDIEQRAGKARAPCDAIHRDRVPADFGVERFGRIDHLGAAPLLFLFPADGNVGHVLKSRRVLT